MYEAAEDILHQYEKLHSELLEMKKVVSGTIRIATIYSSGLHELPPCIELFLQEYPQVNVRIECRRNNLVYEDRPLAPRTSASSRSPGACVSS